MGKIEYFDAKIHAKVWIFILRKNGYVIYLAKLMQRMFSKKLMIKAKRVFEKQSGRVLSEDEVEMLLEKLAKFGKLYADIIIEFNEKQNEINSKEI